MSSCPNHLDRPKQFWIQTEDGFFVKVCYECYLKDKDSKK